jgi:hypothetical protein
VSTRRALTVLCLPLLACGDPGSATTFSATTIPGNTLDPGTTATSDPTGAPTTAAPDTTAADTTTTTTSTGDLATTTGPASQSSETGAPATSTTTAESTTDSATDTTGEPADVPLLAGYPTWVHFTDPPAHGGEDPTILDEIVRLINDTPDDGTIHAAIHSLTANTVADALQDARARGVTVLVAEDGSDRFDSDGSPLELHDAFGDDHVFCGDGVEGQNYGCITTDASGIMHSKLYTFSRTRDPNGTLRDDVVWFGSANMTYATGAATFNNTVTIYGDAGLFADLDGYFGQLFAQDHFAGNNFYDAPLKRGYYDHATARIYASPEQDSDLVVNRLNDIEPGDDCEVRVMHASIHDSRPQIVDLLVDLEQGGCDVEIIANNVETDSPAELEDAGVSVRKNIVHDKVVIVAARFAGSPDVRHLVFTGSHNWTYSANYRNDELFVKIEDEAIHALYAAHFADADATSSPY